MISLLLTAATLSMLYFQPAIISFLVGETGSEDAPSALAQLIGSITPSPTQEPTATPIVEPTVIATARPTLEITPTPTPTSTPTPAATPTLAPTATPTSSPNVDAKVSGDCDKDVHIEGEAEVHIDINCEEELDNKSSISNSVKIDADTGGNKEDGSGGDVTIDLNIDSRIGGE